MRLSGLFLSVVAGPLLVPPLLIAYNVAKRESSDSMSKILRSKNLATKFQILAEIASSQPNIQQKAIAHKLGVTPQAISDYVKELLQEGLVASQGRSVYRVTKEGVDWLLQMARDLHDYLTSVNKVVTDISTWTALAGADLKAGQKVGLEMRDGLLVAVRSKPGKARATAVTDAMPGEDIGVSNIEGMIELQPGPITIVRVPGVQRGGSRAIDPARLSREGSAFPLVGAIGIEALASLKRAGVAQFFFYGVKEAVVEAASSGLPCLVVCVEDEVTSLVGRLEEEKLSYVFLDLTQGAGKMIPHRGAL